MNSVAEFLFRGLGELSANPLISLGFIVVFLGVFLTLKIHKQFRP